MDLVTFIYFRKQMTLDDILDEWKKDCALDEHSLDRESLRTSELHNKYLKMLLDQRSRLKMLKIEINRFRGELKSYLKGELNNPEDLKRLGREPSQIKILDRNMDNYLDQDSAYINYNLKLIEQEEKVYALEEVLNQLNKRGFQIKEAVAFLKLKSGY